MKAVSEAIWSRWAPRGALLCGLITALVSFPLHALAELPTGYLVWSKGIAGDPGSRKIFRMTLPDKTDIKALTTGEDVECQISPSGKWVAYAKAKLDGGSDYHNFKLWKIYLVSIHGAEQGRREIKIDDDGAWPSWGADDVLYYNQADGTHSKIIRVTLGELGTVQEKKEFFSTKAAFPTIQEVTECAVAPDESWFAARTRGSSSVNGVSAFSVSPAAHFKLAQAGSIGCMPYVAPSGEWGLIAGATHGIRWGHAPHMENRKEDQLLIPARTAEHKAYHPGVSTDEKWVLAGQGIDPDHNSGQYDLYLYALDAAAMTVGPEQALASDGFNGWPHLWVGEPSAPPPPRPQVAEFFPDSYTVSPGAEVLLSWITFGGDHLELDGASVAEEGTQQVQPTTTTTYTLTVGSSQVSETDTRTVTVTVNATPQAVDIQRLELAPEAIEQGQSAQLSWQVKNPTTLSLNGQRVAPEGSMELSPLETTEYLLEAQGHQGPASKKVELSVGEIDRGLLPDEGGFLCRLGASPLVGEAIWIVGLLLGVLCVCRWRRRHRG